MVDDEPNVIRTLQHALETEHDVVALTKAHEAFQRIAAGERFDIIFCDLMMPEVSGMDFHTQLLHAVPEQADNVIFLTGGAFTPQARAYLDTVTNQRIAKPFDIKSLRALIRALLK